MKTFFVNFLLILLYSNNILADEKNSLLKQIQTTEDPIEKVRLYIELGDKYENSDPGRAIYYYETAFNLGSKIKEETREKSLIPQLEILRAKSLRYIGIVYSTLGNYEEALERYSQAQEVLLQIRDYYTTPYRKEVDTKFAKLLNDIGVVYSRQGVFGVARDYYREALEIYQELQDSVRIAIALSSMGIIEARQANMWEALRNFQLALEIYTKNDNHEGMAQSFNNIAGIYFQLNNWDEALYLYKRALEVFQELGLHQRVAAIFNNIGLTYQNKGDFGKAFENLEKSLSIRTDLNYQADMVESYNNLGVLHAELNDFNKAREYYSKSLDLSLQVGEQRIAALSFINIGRVFKQSGNINAAIDNTTKGLEIARNHNYKFVLQLATEQLAELYALAGLYKRAYELALEYHVISREILDEQIARQINELEIESKAREKQQRIEILEREKALINLKARQSGTLVFLLAILLFVTVIAAAFTFLMIRQRNKIALLKKEQEAKSLISKTDNDLKAILKTHAHAMILFDNELNIIAFNEKAQKWSPEFINTMLKTGDSFFLSTTSSVNELVNDVLFFSLRGESKEMEKVFYSKEGNKKYFKIYSNPVLSDMDQTIQSVSLMIEDITLRKDSEARVMSDLREKETLIHEIHHRVKNNMQVIISLIRLQIQEIQGKPEKEAFLELEQRISAMSFVHEELYKSNNLTEIKFDDYLDRISANLVSIYHKGVKVKNHLHATSNYLNIDFAVPCGLIVNELLTNSLKHAFNENKGKRNNKKQVDVYFTESESGYELQVIDNGSGMKKKFDVSNTKSMGLHLVKVIVEEQLRGVWKIENDGGLQVSIAFPGKN
ncbi:MAG: hypothetical protein EA393_14690 [Bacteroidetes bacterium]|nr:MAG: hypothetical protein EA393_14690 [Bacteroidota bacterium]